MNVYTTKPEHKTSRDLNPVFKAVKKRKYLQGIEIISCL